MLIGLTFDLAAAWAAAGLAAEDLAEFDAPETIAAVEEFLTARGHDVVRIGRAQELVVRLARGERWDLVFNICEGRCGAGREALVPALLEAYAIPYTFSGPLTLALALDKALTKRVLRDAGLPTAPFAVLGPATAAAPTDLPFPLFVKPLAEGTGKGINAASLCHDGAELALASARLQRRFGQNVLAETWLPGREFTVGMLGEGEGARVLGVMEISSAAPYGFDTKKHYHGRVSYRLVRDAEARAAGAAALGAWRAIGAWDAGRIDLKSDGAARPMLLEINPLAGLHPVDSDLVIVARLAGYTYEWLLDRIFAKACRRAGMAWRLQSHRQRCIARRPPAAPVPAALDGDWQPRGRDSGRGAERPAEILP